MGKTIHSGSRSIPTIQLSEINKVDMCLRSVQASMAYAPHISDSGNSQTLALSTEQTSEPIIPEEMNKFDSEIASITHTLSQTPDNHPALPQLLTNLGQSYMDQFGVSHNVGDLEKSIEYRSIALTLTPEDDPKMANLAHTLGSAHGKRFQRLGELNDISKAIEYAHTSVNMTPEGNPDLPRYLMNLGTLLKIRSEYLGNPVDLEDAIEHHSCALALAPDGHPDLPIILANLGASHRNRFNRMGVLNDLDDAITYESRGISLILNGDPDLPGRLTNLGVSYNTRFERLGELADLDNAIQYESRALALAPEDYPNLQVILSSLGSSHSNRYILQGHLNDLEKAIEYQSRAVTLTPDGHPHLPFTLANLAKHYRRRFEYSGEPSDIENAIDYDTRALALIPSDHSVLPNQYTNLALAHKDRFLSQGKSSDLESAINYESRAISLIPEDFPESANLQYNHATSRFLCFLETKDISHLLIAFDFLRRASTSLNASPRSKFEFAQIWAKIASTTHHNDRIEAYQTAIDLLPQVIWLGSTTNKRYKDLSKTGALAVHAASAAMHLSKFSLALEWLEHARCVVWNQHLMLRSPVDQLCLVNSDLATRLQTVATELHSAGSKAREVQFGSSGLMSAEQVGQEHRQLARDYADLLAQIRQLEGFKDFLKPMKTNDLVRAARTGPVVMINCHEDRCDALIIRPGEDNVQYIALPNFSVQQAQETRREMEAPLRAATLGERGDTVRRPARQEISITGVLATLWHNVVQPILQFLGFMNDEPTKNLPHITWCPTSALSFLPLHAAGDYDQPRSRVFDYVISSYTPTLTALLASAPSSFDTHCRVLAIGQAATPGHSPLPGTETEIAYLRTHAKENINVKYSELLDNHATVPAVLDAMEQHDWVHLACHAHQNVTDPTQSGFFLHEGILDLAAINRRSFKSKGLAFLSACQTATGDEKLADEAVHLASGMLMAGYTSVIGTMWSVHDDDAPLIADKVYAQLMKDRKLGNGEAGRALHNAVAALRETVGEHRFERWVPYIHIGAAEEAIVFAIDESLAESL